MVPDSVVRLIDVVSAFAAPRFLATLPPARRAELQADLVALVPAYHVAAELHASEEDTLYKGGRALDALAGAMHWDLAAAPEPPRRLVEAARRFLRDIAVPPPPEGWDAWSGGTVLAPPPASPSPATPTQRATSNLRCSFCGLRRAEVERLISGPKVYICDQCIGLCNDILAEDFERPADPADWRPLTLEGRALEWRPTQRQRLVTLDEIHVRLAGEPTEYSEELPAGATLDDSAVARVALSYLGRFLGG